MCITCGCSDDANPTFTNLSSSHLPDHDTDSHHHGLSEHTHVLPDGTVIRHTHDQSEQSDTSETSEATPITTTSTATTASMAMAKLHATVHSTTVAVERNLLSKNDGIATQNREYLKSKGILGLNLVSSPGSGKTTLLTRTLHDLSSRISFSVIEGDQETLNDAQRIRETGCPVIQVNTGTGCHLEAAMVQRGIQTLQPPSHSVLMIENVGNLVCPALFDLGEEAKVAILSVTEGEDKPLKYPHMFRASQVMMLTKTDLLPYVNFDVDQCIRYARQVNPHIQVLQVSATTGEGLNNWYDWITQRMNARGDAQPVLFNP